MTDPGEGDMDRFFKTSDATGPSGKGRVKGINHNTFLTYILIFSWFWFKMLLLKGIFLWEGEGRLSFEFACAQHG